MVILPPTEKARVAALWELVDGGAGFDVTLDALISGGLRDLPGFVLVCTAEGETQVVIRGPARAEFRSTARSSSSRAPSATTWVERVAARRRADEHRPAPRTRDDELPSYVVDGGLFRISRLDEAPAHEGPDELGEEPAYEREFPLPAGPIAETPEPRTSPRRRRRATTAPPIARAAGLEPAPPACRRPCRRPAAEPPLPPPPPAGARADARGRRPSRCPSGRRPTTDHDGLTVAGAWEPPPRRRPASPASRPRPTSPCRSPGC